MINEIKNYVTNLRFLVELPLRRTACPESSRRVQGSRFYSAMYCIYLVTLSEAKGYSLLTIDHSRL